MYSLLRKDYINPWTPHSFTIAIPRLRPSHQLAKLNARLIMPLIATAILSWAASIATTLVVNQKRPQWNLGVTVIMKSETLT